MREKSARAAEGLWFPVRGGGPVVSGPRAGRPAPTPPRREETL